jgi:hypothetical protein
VALHREFDGAEPVRPEPVESLAGRRTIHQAQTVHELATGTLACPSCDAPVLPAPGGMTPADTLSCAFCAHAGAVRDFLSLAEPTRPTRVVVRLRGFAPLTKGL